MPGTPWTLEQESHLLRRRAEGASLVTIADELRIPLMGVRHKAARINAGVIPTRRGWSKVEERRLRRLYADRPWDEIEGAFPGRTREAIGVRAAALGLRRRGMHEATEELSKIAAMSETTAAYIAGLVDGEGSIILTKRGYLRLHLGSTCEPAIRFLQEHAGGNVYAYPTGGGLGKKPFWRWALTKHRAVLALVARMEPYMIIKAQNVARGPGRWIACG